MNRITNRTDRLTTVKISVIFVLFLIVAAVVVGELVSLQLYRHEEYQSQVLNQLTVQQGVTPERGDILDRNGNVLATNKTVYDVILSPKDIEDRAESDRETAEERRSVRLTAATDKENQENKKSGLFDRLFHKGETAEETSAESEKQTEEEIAPFLYMYEDEEYGISYMGDDVKEAITEVLSVYLNVERAEIEKREANVKRLYERVQKNVEADLADRIEQFIDQCNLKKLVYFVASSKRYYPRGELACHALGFTNSEGTGVYGLEAQYDSLLRGASGKYILAQDARGNDMPFEYERFILAVNGYDLVTTLDIYIQYELENQLEKTFVDSGAGERVCGIVMEPETGAILAMAVYPPFDPNEPFTLNSYAQAKFDEQVRLEGLVDDPTRSDDDYDVALNEARYRMWNNKCITETYEPGSTFKIITTSAALEEGAVSQFDQFYCGGSYVVEGWSKPIACAEASGHGWVTFRYGLQQSCNPTLMQTALRLGKEKFYDYFKAFGYGGKTGIDLPGETGSIYASFEDFSLVSLAVYSFGQTFKTTPIQQLRAVSSVANGGTLMTPHLMNRILDEDGNVVQSYEPKAVRQVVSEETCDLVMDILEEGVATDGAAKNAYVKGYRVAAKTGTSEKLDVYDEFGNRPYRVGSTVAFAPADDPRISALIMVDTPLLSGPYGGTVAAPYISNLLAYTLPYIGIEPQYTTEELAKLDIAISNYVTCTVEDSVADLYWRDIPYEIIGEGDVVTAQVPAAGARISSDTGMLLLYTGGETPVNDVTVPDLMGMSAYNANNLAVSAGLNVTLFGSTNGSTATVIGQYPTPGTLVPRGTVVEIELRHMDGID